MTADDVPAAVAVQVSAFHDLERRFGEDPAPPTDEMWQGMRERQHHLRTTDPGGAWVAADGDDIVGCALALRRESLWGLSLLVVDPGAQSSGAGRQLLNASLTYAEGCDRAVILSSPDPRAMRAYATSGFDLHPQVRGVGVPDPTALRADYGRVRAGSLPADGWVDEVDRAVRGAPRGPDHERLAGAGSMYVVNDAGGRGYAYLRPRENLEIAALAATNEQTAAALLWRCLAHAAELGSSAEVVDLNAAQQWAITIAYEARLKVMPAGPVFWRGAAPPAAYLPSGAYL